MARPSKIDRLPREVREEIGRLREGGRTIDEILDHLRQLDADVSRSGLARHIQRVDAIAARVRESRAAAQAIMDRLGARDDEGRVARLNVELLHASVMQLLAGEEGEEVRLDPQSAMFLGRTLRDLTTAAKTDADREMRVRQQLRTKLDAKLQEIESDLDGEALPDRDAVLRRIREDVYGMLT